MRVLVVASYNKGRFAPFIEEQARALEAQGCVIRFFGLQGKGIGGYIRNLPLLKRKSRRFNLTSSMRIMAFLACSPICKDAFLW